MKQRRINARSLVMSAGVLLCLVVILSVAVGGKTEPPPVVITFQGFVPNHHTSLQTVANFGLRNESALFIQSNRTESIQRCSELRLQVKAGNAWTNFPQFLDLCCELDPHLDPRTSRNVDLWLPNGHEAWRASIRVSSPRNWPFPWAEKQLQRLGIPNQLGKRTILITSPEYSL